MVIEGNDATLGFKGKGKEPRVKENRFGLPKMKGVVLGGPYVALKVLKPNVGRLRL